MKVQLIVFIPLIACVHSVDLDYEEDVYKVTEEPYPVKEFSQLLNTLNDLDLSITRVLSSTAPDKTVGDKLVLDLQGYVMSLGPLTHNMAGEDSEVLLVAKSVYRQGAPKFLATPINSELLRQTFGWDENQMTLLNTVYSMAAKTWRNFLNMCERHRVEG